MNDGPEGEIYSAYVDTPDLATSTLLLACFHTEVEGTTFSIPLDAVLHMFEFTHIDVLSPLGVVIVGVEGGGASHICGKIKIGKVLDERTVERWKRERGHNAEAFGEVMFHNRHAVEVELIHVFPVEVGLHGDPEKRTRQVTFVHGPTMKHSPSLHLRSIFMADAAIVCVPIMREITTKEDWLVSPTKQEFRQVLLRCFAARIRWIVVAVTHMDRVEWNVELFHHYCATCLTPTLSSCGFPKHRVTFVPTGWKNYDLLNILESMYPHQHQRIPSLFQAVSRLRREKHPCEAADSVFRFQSSLVHRIGGIGTVAVGRVVSGSTSVGALCLMN
eukprot:PhF_6_TR30381/c0_g1_i3/m.44531/K03231/EEF1A; elongation factor 1-alpha